jgi:hypothetical protein
MFIYIHPLAQCILSMSSDVRLLGYGDVGSRNYTYILCIFGIRGWRGSLETTKCVCWYLGILKLLWIQDNVWKVELEYPFNKHHIECEDVGGSTIHWRSFVGPAALVSVEFWGERRLRWK